ncbi:MAG: AAA family ATPase [Fibrobacteria bacterium]|nr:AAA family ATPase [Fibrobacteria bacterium]
MKIEALRLKNFRAFRDTEWRGIPAFAVVVGANGTGKSTLFKVFEFLRDCMRDNVQVALAKLGGGKGFEEVRSRDADGPIEIELKFRDDGPLVTYSLQIDLENGRPIVTQEILKYRRGQYGQPWRFLDFSRGEGLAVTNEMAKVQDDSQLTREKQTLKSSDILAIKGLAQFEKFPAVKALGNLIENWHISDFHISKARPEQDVGHSEHLTREGENLSLVVDYLYRFHRPIFDTILEKLKNRIPGLSKVESKVTEEGKVLLKFQDGSFEDPFLARHVSDGTIKMLAYLVLLHDPKPHSLLCVEEPENQLYPSLLEELAEEFRDHARQGGQVLVSTHSPDLLNATELDEVFWIVKRKGYSRIQSAADSEQVAAYMRNGDKMGHLWKQGFFEGVNP